jgi:hypothetical protein
MRFLLQGCRLRIYSQGGIPATKSALKMRFFGCKCSLHLRISERKRANPPRGKIPPHLLFPFHRPKTAARKQKREFIIKKYYFCSRKQHLSLTKNERYEENV